ncbi:MAG: Preprotein translocase, SecE subunit [Candidatus Uhrbacteria bacterium GW2011_GWE2_40_58]|nr:MAG: Preprotein translocase, SecE subunit [Candidatus Uhrbacteria bacterium GW2011_GWF2_40_263]KKR68028.1 MAG: Preprotein translocase, SecE subunit [Candidatus Uhrbacteria bacterium GW2011_GWE2_40_58]OGL92937.1 MAG: preprotein translocase subunit SecE [Candidatus Uhrbacteria bacterium RIFOXYA2_FULL_40_9]OGL97075.1 MAG: preprotein translocase subunit SecE [Candidatus Uhrbacteria bacterium RIFOXYB2_FULL_41_18]HBK34617.1 preprotein translocase subunit SecE [Candidatus Uhrbacteria bacterium]
MESSSQKSLISGLFQYFRDAKSEVGKVTWPSKKDTMKYSILVIAISVIIAAFFGGLDWVLNLGVQELITLVS